MSQFFKYFFAALLAIVVSGVLLVIVFFGVITAAISSAKSDEEVVVKEKSVLVVDLSQSIHEVGQEDFTAMFTGGERNNLGLWDAISAIKKAEKDDNIKGIYVKAGSNGNAMATSQQVRNALLAFKKSGKWIVSYSESMDQKSYYIASVADSLYIHPMGTVELKGLATNLTFFQGSLEKLGVKPVIFYCGKFKSATEPFRAKEMSEPNRVQIQGIQHTVWNEMLNAYHEKSGLSIDSVFALAKTASVQTSNDAVKYHLANGAKYKDEVESMLKQKLSVKEKDKINFVTLSEYIKSNKTEKADNQIALLVAEGEIVDGDGNGSAYQIATNSFVQQIRKVKDNDDIKAVVLRVNSPGGSALASESILRELQLLKAKKHLVVSMGDYAASGGYYIACQADSIFAMPTTITGSIGVFGLMFNPQELMTKKLGVTFDVEKNAPFADFPNLTRDMSEQEKEIMQHGVDTIYSVFKSRVSVGRRKSVEYIDSIAQGHVWTGEAALANGLVDRIGGLEEAFASAASLARIKTFSVRTYPKAKNQFEELMKSLSGKGADEVLAKKLLQPHFAEELHAWQTIQMFTKNKNRIWAVLPFDYRF